MPQYNECSNINTNETTDVHSASFEREIEREEKDRNRDIPNNFQNILQ